MKLRIRGNSVRLRVTKSELDRIARTGLVEDAVQFGAGARLVYRLAAVADGPVAATLSNAVLSVCVPAATVASWASSDQVSIAGEQALDGGETLRILVEKDFECLAPRADEPPGDFFENPAVTRD